MYLYATTVRPGQASPMKVVDWALRMTEKINQISEVPARLWTSAMSPGMGNLTWTSVVEDLSIVETTETKLAADAGYQLLIDEAAGLLSATQAADQFLSELVYSDPAAATIDAQYASTVQARLAPGNFTQGVQLGVEIAQQVGQITGQPNSFAVGVTGDYGAVMWVGLAETIEQLQAAGRAINGNADFARRIDTDASKAFTPGTQTISRRLA